MGAHSYSYDDNGNVLSDGERTLTWTAQNMVRSLQRGGQAWSLLYDADGTRVVREEAASNSATYNVGSTYELRFDGAELSEARISVLGATGRVVAEVFAERTALEENALWEHRKKFVHDDHLGSAHMISDREGTVEARVIYGPWGAARDGNNWSLPVTESGLEDLPTGFTGHQPELDAGLINMRGRMYDPAVGRFMSVDPVIENALEVGTWNAYSYVLNRPLSLVDPTGLAAGTQADIERNESFLAEQGFVGADYHNVEAYYANIEFWKPYKAQTHGPRKEEETQKSGKGKPVQAVVIDIKIAGDSDCVGLCKTIAESISEDGSTIHPPAPITEETEKTIDEAVEASGRDEVGWVVGGVTVALLIAGIAVTSGGVAALLGPKCFAKGTLVYTEDGLRAIEHIRPGDMVWARDDETGDEGWKPVLRVIETRGARVLKLTFESGDGSVEFVRSTEEHPFWSMDENGWVEAGDLEVGEVVFTLRGWAQLSQNDPLPEPETVHNFEVAESHTYFVGDMGLWVHNNPACLTPQTISLVERGVIKEGGKLQGVLAGIESGFSAQAPTSAPQAMGIIARATEAMGLEVGVGTLTAGGGFVLQNVGNIITTVTPGGAITIQRGSEILLNLVP